MPLYTVLLYYQYSHAKFLIINSSIINSNVFEQFGYSLDYTDIQIPT